MSNKINKPTRSLGVIHDLSSHYFQVKQNITDRKASLNDSAGLMTEKPNPK